MNNRFNDGKCAPDGHLFAGTISLVKNEGDADLYRLSPDLEVTKAYGPVTNSNGIVWSADGATCYYIDTPTPTRTSAAYSEARSRRRARDAATWHARPRCTMSVSNISLPSLAAGTQR